MGMRQTKQGWKKADAERCGSRKKGVGWFKVLWMAEPHPTERERLRNMDPGKGDVVAMTNQRRKEYK